VTRAWRRISAYGHDRLATPEERRPAGRLNAALWLCGSLTLLLILPLPGTRLDRPGVVAAAAGGLLWSGALLWLVPWARMPRRFFHASTVLLLVAVAVLQPLTGRHDSPAHEFLWLVLVYAAFFYRAVPAIAYWIAICVVDAAPLIYASEAVEGNLPREMLVIVPASAIVAALVFAGRELLVGLSRQARALEREQRRLAADQASLRRVATAVAAGSPPQAIFTLVSAEAGRLLGADAAAIGRYLGALRLHATGVWAADGRSRTAPGQVHELEPGDELARVHVTGRPVRMAEEDDGRPSMTRTLGYRSFVAAPVYSGPSVWGVLGVAARRARTFPPGAEDRLREYADLIATAVRNAEDRARLHRQSGVDELTALPNHQAFRERLQGEVSRARRYDRPLTVAVLDVDRFRELTDEVGPEEGDRAVAEMATRLQAVLRDEDVVARLGADEFGIAFLESHRATALLAAERARQAIASAPLRHGMHVTVSVGLCDLDAAQSADDLLRRADAALFWSKEHGRDRCWVYDPSVVRDLAHDVRRLDAEREQGLAGLRALARAIDAKDPATSEHSERVAALAGRLAAECGWDPERIERLREAAALHDVGKVGVPDAVLLKPGPLDEAETALMREHAPLGARIVCEVLDETQVHWIGAHHERPDGLGYPSGLPGPRIPEGAALLALADAWDSMLSPRVFSPARTVPDALREVSDLAGRQFDPKAVRALEALHERGALAPAAARMHRPTPDAPASRAA